MVGEPISLEHTIEYHLYGEQWLSEEICKQMEDRTSSSSDSEDYSEEYSDDMYD